MHMHDKQFLSDGEDKTVYLILQDRIDGERLYWNNNIGWVGERESGNEFLERPLTIPAGCNAYVYEYKLVGDCPIRVNQGA